MPAQSLGGPPSNFGDGYNRSPGYDGGGDYDPDATGYLPPVEPDRSRAKDWTLKGLGLLGVALVSGVLWWAVMHKTPAPTVAAPPANTHHGTYQFVPYQGTSTSSTCADHASGQVASFLTAHPCQKLTRALFTTTLNGHTVVTSVIDVQMANGSDANSLNSLGQVNNSGHVKDLVEDGTTTIPGGPKRLQDAGYKSMVSGDTVMIATTEYQDASLDAASSLSQTSVDDTLKKVSQDALNQNLLNA
jgi:hypothetical protein